MAGLRRLSAFGRSVSSLTQRVLASSLFVAMGLVLLLQARPAGSFSVGGFALCLLLTGVCAFLQPSVGKTASGGGAASRHPAPLGPAWLRISLGVSASLAAVVGFALDRFV